MKNWQKERNYKKAPNGDGSCKYFITIDGEDIEVNANVYKAYSSADRRERYCYEREDGLLLSLERLDEDHVPLACVMDRHLESAEDVVLSAIELETLREALNSFTPEERHLIESLVFEGVSERKYAALIGIAQKNVNKKKQRLLHKLKKFINF